MIYEIAEMKVSNGKEWIIITHKQLKSVYKINKVLNVGEFFDGVKDYLREFTQFNMRGLEIIEVKFHDT